MQQLQQLSLFTWSQNWHKLKGFFNINLFTKNLNCQIEVLCHKLVRKKSNVAYNMLKILCFSVKYCRAPGQGQGKVELKSSLQVKNYSAISGIDLTGVNIIFGFHPTPPHHTPTRKLCWLPLDSREDFKTFLFYFFFQYSSEKMILPI